MSVLSSALVVLQAKNYSGSGNWLDESGNSNDATVGGTPDFDGVKFTLDGSTDYFQINTNADVDMGAESLTLLVWAMIPDLTPAAESTLVAKKAGTISNLNGAGYAISNGSGGAVSFKTAKGDGSALDLDAAVGITEGSPFVIVGRRDVVGGEVETFVDGSGSGSPDSTIWAGTLTNTKHFVIGANSQDTPAEFLAGDIYAVALWDSALSDANIALVTTEIEATGSLLLLGLG